MSKIFVFSGTTEGKLISRALSKASIYHTVFVATEYGKLVMDPSEYADIKEGRMDADDMEKLFTESTPKYVIDATHPYAVEVTKNIRKSCEKAGVIESYVRVVRRCENTNEYEHAVSCADAIDKLKSTDGNILLTTGVKTLPEYMAQDEIKDRIYARILPSVESLNIALNTGIKPGHIIAQEGPFSTQSNEALISQYDIKVLVTKNSGDRGGFKEKIEAALNKNIKVIVIDQESVDEGISVEEAIKLATGRCDVSLEVIVAGIGVGNIDSLTVGVKKAIEKADLLIGASRMVSFGKELNPRAKIVCEYDAFKIAEAIEMYKPKNPVVLMSGDTGFHSGAAKAGKVLEEKGYEVVLMPGISSISYFSSLIGWEYENIISLHGQDNDLAKIPNLESFFAILSGPEDIKKVTSVLNNDWEVAVGYNLGYEDSSVDISRCSEVKEYDEKGLYVMAARKV